MNENQIRLDASESVFFSRELEAIDARMYDVKFPMLKGRQLLPPVAGVGEADDSYTYRMFETLGQARIVDDSATDLDVVQAKGTETTARIKEIATSYGYSIMDIKRAAALSRPLDDMLARAARRATEEAIDTLLAFGSAEHNMMGFVNNSEVEDSDWSPGNKAAGGADTWLDSGAPHATGAEMVADVNAFVSKRWGVLKEAEGLGGKMVIVLPADEFAYLATTPMGDNADKTALRYLLDNNPFLEAIEPWHKLSGAGDSGKNRMIGYIRDPQVLGSLIPMEYSPQPAQQVGLRYKIPVLARCGGCVIRYPVAVGYGDGI